MTWLPEGKVIYLYAELSGVKVLLLTLPRSIPKLLVHLLKEGYCTPTASLLPLAAERGTSIRSSLNPKHNRVAKFTSD
jgi:hypothetical protein